MLASLSRFNDSGVPTAVNLSVDVGPSHLSPPSPALGARDAAMDTGIVTPLLLSLLAGSATGIGGLIVLFGPCSNPSDTTISYALSFAAGVMTTVSIQDLWWPLAVRSQSDFWIATLWLVVGAALARAFNYLPVPDPEALVVASFASEAGGAALRLPGGGTTVSTPHSAAAKRTSAWRLGFLLTVVLTVHNFPEGLLVGVGAVKSLELGLTLCAAIMLHNVAEGIVVAVPVLAGTGSKSTALMLTVFSVRASGRVSGLALLYWHSGSLPPRRACPSPSVPFWGCSFSERGLRARRWRGRSMRVSVASAD